MSVVSKASHTLSGMELYCALNIPVNCGIIASNVLFAPETSIIRVTLALYASSEAAPEDWANTPEWKTANKMISRNFFICVFLAFRKYTNNKRNNKKVKVFAGIFYLKAVNL